MYLPRKHYIMINNQNNFFDAVFSSDDFRQSGFENRVVRRVINECGIKPQSWGKLVNKCREVTGQPYFTFSWFNEFFPAFPGQLCGKRIGYCGTVRDDNGQPQKRAAYQLNLAELLKPEKNLFVRAIASALHGAGTDTQRPFVFLFPIVRRMFCAHNLFIETPAEQPRAQWVFSHNHARMSVEPSAVFFRALGTEWYSEE